MREADVRALRNHDPNFILGRTKAGVGNIRLVPDATGLYHELDVPDTATARSMYEDVRGRVHRPDELRLPHHRGRVGAEPADTTVPERRLLEVALEDISYVAYPAYPQTTANARAALRSFASAVGVDVDELPDLATTVTTQEPSGPPPEQRRHPKSRLSRSRRSRPRKFYVIQGV